MLSQLTAGVMRRRIIFQPATTYQVSSNGDFMIRVLLRSQMHRSETSSNAPDSTLGPDSQIEDWAFRSPSRLEIVAYAGIVAIATLAAAGLLVQNFNGNLLGPSGDENLFSYQAYFFGRNLSLLPIPHLNFNSNQTFYPYGVDHVFQPWGLEREYIGAGCQWLFGNGPWMQLYFGSSVFECRRGQKA